MHCILHFVLDVFFYNLAEVNTLHKEENIKGNDSLIENGGLKRKETE